MTERERRDSPRLQRELTAWLDEVAPALGVDRAELSAVTPELLRLVSEVAHGPSRPGAPLTAFALGVAAGRSGEGLEPGFEAGATVVRTLLAARPRAAGGDGFTSAAGDAPAAGTTSTERHDAP